ncbi:MAG: cyclic nucleotide-binding domain-containing protein [Deltaproteobacteria bacterium]|jgi:CRP-like cAMP-binding protein|nr:cyclic nucleotide-binding domain-containing protein [Deltaproteobacteria bacterium]MDO9211838.1 cyclic nucleotide-binding domain-containing protein [Deltaproteobacteria bacterium]
MKKEEQLFWKFGKDFPKGTVLFREGELGRDMFIIQKGKVQVRKKVGTTEKVLAELSDGEFFGEMALLMGMDRSATVEVIEDSKILVVSPDTFESLLKGNIEIALKMLKKMASRLRALDERLETAILEAQKERQ